MKAKHFKIQELVDKETYERYGQKAWWFLDNRLIMLLDRLREDLQRPITVNNWLWGGNNQHRGLRPPKCNIGADYSQHRFGRAVDFDVKGMKADQVRSYIRNRINNYPEIKGIETGITWVHLDIRNSDDLLIFKP